MNKEDIEKLVNLDYHGWGNSDGADTEWLFNKMQELAKIALKQAADLKNQTETIKEQRRELRESERLLFDRVLKAGKLELEVNAWRERFPAAGFDGKSIVISG